MGTDSDRDKIDMMRSVVNEAFIWDCSLWKTDLARWLSNVVTSRQRTASSYAIQNWRQAGISLDCFSSFGLRIQLDRPTRQCLHHHTLAHSHRNLDLWRECRAAYFSRVKYTDMIVMLQDIGKKRALSNSLLLPARTLRLTNTNWRA